MSNKPLGVLVVNDIHIGVTRQAGTTKTSSAALREYLVSSFQDMVLRYVESLSDYVTMHTLVINGDLFDSFSVPPEDVCELFKALSWIAPDFKSIQIVAGNHDVSRDESAFGALDLLGQLLEASKGSENWKNTSVDIVYEPCNIPVTSVGWFPNIWMIPHRPTQAQFEEDLIATPHDAKALLLHCNYDNQFAAQTDHSLNLSKAMATSLFEETKVEHIILGHEHRARDVREFGGRLHIPGNQIPSSIADCQGAQFQATLIEINQTDFSVRVKHLQKIKKQRVFATLDVNTLIGADLDLVLEDLKGVNFVQVSGEVLPTQVNDAYIKVAQLRRMLPDSCFVLSASSVTTKQAEALEVGSLGARSEGFNLAEAVRKQLGETMWNVLSNVLES